MATYKGIKGFTVQSLATDPVGAGVTGATWSSGADVNQAGTNLFGVGTSKRLVPA